MNEMKVTVRNSDQFPINLTYKGEATKLGDSDFFVFTVREKIGDDKYLIRREIDNNNYNEELGCYLLDIFPSDTVSVKLEDYKDEKIFKYDITLYNRESEDFEKTLRKGDFIVSWRASEEGDENV